MAPEIELDLTAVAIADRKQTYWILYQMMKTDFVHREDLATILNTATVNGGSVATSLGPEPVIGARLAWSPTEVAAVAKAVEYEGKIKAGEAAREGITSAAEAVLGLA